MTWLCVLRHCLRAAIILWGRLQDLCGLTGLGNKFVLSDMT